MRKPKILVFGTGGLYQCLKDFIFYYYDVVAFYDNDTTKRGMCLDGMIVRHVDEGFPDDYQFILVASMYFSEIRVQLIAAGICDIKIKNINFDSLIGRAVWSSRHEKTMKNRELVRRGVSGSLLIVINSLRAGGAEKALVNLLDLLGKRNISVNVISIFGGGIYKSQIRSPHLCFELFSPEENAVAGIVLNTIPFDELYEDMLGLSFDTVIAFIEGPATLFCSNVPAKKRISWCHTNLNDYHWTKNFFPSYDSEMACYNVFDELIFVSPSGLKGFCELFPCVTVNKSVIPNVFNIEKIKSLATEKVHYPCFTFVSVGRLVDVKGFDRLINAFSKLCESVKIDIALIIIGDGDKKSALQIQIESLNIKNNVVLLGFVENPYKYIAAADVYVSSSHVEGQPLSIGEAMLLNKPIIATNNYGSNNILQCGEFGLLVENSTDGIFSGMCRAVTDKSFISEYSRRSGLSHEHFSSDEIIAKFIDLIH